MLPEDLAKEAVKADVPIKEIAKWLGVETVGAAKQIIMDVAETSCNDMQLDHKLDWEKDAPTVSHCTIISHVELTSILQEFQRSTTHPEA